MVAEKKVEENCSLQSFSIQALKSSLSMLIAKESFGPHD